MKLVYKQCNLKYMYDSLNGEQPSSLSLSAQINADTNELLHVAKVKQVQLIRVE
jgi:hypothetical protein